jgi:carbon-monoxide dehydrogenase medium subunit
VHLPPFTLHRPSRLEEAFDLLDRYGDDAAFYMGGTELLLLMKLGFAQPGHLVDGKALSELAELRVGPDRIAVGAGVTHRRLERHGDVARMLPALVAMERRVANVRVRNAGTLGGNLCFAEPHSDPMTLLVALGATVELAGRGGTRTLPLSEFCQGAFLTALAPGEVMTRIDVPLPSPGVRVGYQRLAFKERPTAGVAVVLDPSACRVVVGSLGPVPLRVTAAEGPLAAGDVDAAAAAVSEAVAARDSAEGADFRAHLAGVLVRRAVAGARSGPEPVLAAS